MNPRTAVVQDWFFAPGGSEEVAIELANLLPGSDVVTSFMEPAYRARLAGHRIRTWPLQRIVGPTKRYRSFLPLYPLWFGGLDLRDRDLVISSSSAFAKAVRTRKGATHIAYIHAPMRYAWDLEGYLAGASLSPMARIAATTLRPALRRWDRSTARRPDVLVANSAAVAARIRRFWGREARVIHPPVPLDDIGLSTRDDGYLLVTARLLAYRRLDVAIGAANALDRDLLIVGSGPEEQRLRSLAGPTVRFEPTVDRARLRDLMAGCHAYLVPGEEDFGMAPVEAMAAGKPVVAYRAGGALETVVDGRDRRPRADIRPGVLRVGDRAAGWPEARSGRDPRQRAAIRAGGLPVEDARALRRARGADGALRRRRLAFGAARPGQPPALLTAHRAADFAGCSAMLPRVTAKPRHWYHHVVHLQYRRRVLISDACTDSGDAQVPIQGGCIDDAALQLLAGAGRAPPRGLPWACCSLWPSPSRWRLLGVGHQRAIAPTLRIASDKCERVTRAPVLRARVRGHERQRHGNDWLCRRSRAATVHVTPIPSRTLSTGTPLPRQQQPDYPAPTSTSRRQRRPNVRHRHPSLQQHNCSTWRATVHLGEQARCQFRQDQPDDHLRCAGGPDARQPLTSTSAPRRPPVWP